MIGYHRGDASWRIVHAMLSAKRQQAISELVAQSGVVNVVDLARRFEVSTSTI
ncbi:MAG: DeoR family transcriptional regulator, partial [Ardenticatenales bacterium]|nr:DeoR family transcriptional regulator [Ardenticatenales bacterium]